MGNIRDLLNKIRYATYGKEVRQSIHDAIEECYATASVDHDNANMEVKIARGTHNTLNDRITENEKNQENLSSQLETKASKADLIIQSNRIDNFASLPEGSTTGDAELIDARIGADGLTYTNVGTTNRKQFEKITNLVNTIEEYQNAFIPILSESGYIDKNGILQASDKWITFTLPLENGEVYSYKGISHIGSTVYYAIYSTDDTFISSYKCDKTEASNLTFANNASKLKISIYKTEASDFYFLKKQKNTAFSTMRCFF